MKKYFQEKIEQFRPHVLKAASNAAQGYVFGCMVGMFSPSARPTLRNIHESGKSFARVSAIYSATESLFEMYGPKNSPFGGFVSGAVAGGLGVCDKTGRSVLVGAASFGLYSGISGMCLGKDRR